MGNFFELSDFALFAQYANKKQQEAPNGHNPLRVVYDKLGKVIEGLKKIGYPVSINRNPLQQAGPGTFKYAPYHWSRVYPKEQNLFHECYDKVFVVVGTTVDGLNIHIDSYQSKRYVGNEVSEKIKKDTWLTITPEESSIYTCEQIVNLVDEYFKKHWLDFNRFAKEFGIKESIKIINNMDIERIKAILLSNYNIILTGAPGTGKTYLAKEIAKSMGAEWRLVQFHPSYDYTDFVEGLRPVKDGNSLGFQRKDGVFKDFCKRALEEVSSFDNGYNKLVNEINQAESQSKDYYCSTLGHDNVQFKISASSDGIVYQRKAGNTTASKKELHKLFDYFLSQNITDVGNQQRNNMEIILGRMVDYTNWRGILQKIIDFSRSGNTRKQFVFIIDEINRGEISKIFGELFYSIDPGYRGTIGKVTTQYQNLVPNDDVFYEGFYVPENVYIIGTMNDIDRSVESMDFAMRRRFAWKEIKAESRQSMLDDEKAWGMYGKPDQSVIDEIKVRMNNLNACIIDTYGDEDLSPKDKIGLTKAYQIGASYFLKYGMYGNFNDLWENHLEGLLYEYLRGTTNIEAKIIRLHSAYNDTTAH